MRRVAPAALAVVVGMAGLPGSVAPAAAAVLSPSEIAGEVQAVWCQCVAYVKNRFGLSRGANAKDMGPVLEAAGFRRVWSPEVGAVVIFQSSFGPGVNQSDGHIGVISNVQQANAGRNWWISVRGADRGWGGVTEHNCTNATTVRFRSYPKGNGSVAHYVRKVPRVGGPSIGPPTRPARYCPPT